MAFVMTNCSHQKNKKWLFLVDARSTERSWPSLMAFRFEAVTHVRRLGSLKCIRKRYESWNLFAVWPGRCGTMEIMTAIIPP